jgi:hypothetical protein
MSHSCLFAKSLRLDHIESGTAQYNSTLESVGGKSSKNLPSGTGGVSSLGLILLGCAYQGKEERLFYTQVLQRDLLTFRGSR